MLWEDGERLVSGAQLAATSEGWTQKVCEGKRAGGC